MMTIYRIQDPVKGEIVFQDKKRWLWIGSILLTLVPMAFVFAFVQTQNHWFLLMPLLFGYIIVPFIDYVVGEDRTNPPEEIVAQLDADPYYKNLLVAIIPFHFVLVFVSAWVLAQYSVPWWTYLGFSVLIGMYSGLGINTAHEIGHKTTKRDRLLSRIALAPSGYGHFCIEHNLGHHRDVATPEDPASSRMGESIYRFALREIPGAAVRGWSAERDRLAKRGIKFWSMQNHILQSYALTLVFQGSLVALFGWQTIFFLIIHNVVAWFQLTSANYIEHYGLLREKNANGRYERCKPHHSWNANHLFSNILFFQLERHSDHHSNASRPYQSLRSFDDLPELPSGYFGMYTIAYIPSLWFWLMDKRLMAIPHINGDLSKVNIDPKYAQRIHAKWGRQPEMV